MKKYVVLTTLFVLPLVVYLFFASGINHFAKLPVLTKNVKDISDISNESLKDKITVLGFFGNNIEEKYGDAGNLNQEIFKRFNEFKDFQFIMIQPEGTKILTENLMNVFNSLKTDIKLDSNLGTSHVFIIDRKGNLRGRDDEDGAKFGYDSRFVADINNNMVDDVKVILAEYRMALKKNNIYKDQL